MRRVHISGLLATILLTTACRDSTAPGATRRPLLAESALQQLVAESWQLARTIRRPNEEAWQEAAKSIPGFAGIRFDDDGNLVVLMASSDRHADARTAAEEILRLTGRPSLDNYGKPLRVSVVRVRYPYTQLARWRDSLLLPVLDGSGASQIDLDEDRNAIAIGVGNDAADGAVRAILQSLQIPVDAIVIERTPGGSEIASLSDRWRPVMGGTQFGYQADAGATLRGPCTVGIPILRNGQRGFLTASHCTRARNTPESSLAWQPLNHGVSLGTETFDRSGSSCGPFNGLNCRHADIAIIGLQTLDSLPGETGFSVGRIARTSAPTAGVGNGYGTLQVAGSWNALGMFNYPLSNEILHKVGSTTGWTYGKVYKTCVTKDIPGYRYWCQDFVEVNGELGDSGSPVFRLYTDTYTGQPYANAFFLGILWAADAAPGPSHSGGIFGNVSQIVLEIGAFQVTP